MPHRLRSIPVRGWLWMVVLLTTLLKLAVVFKYGSSYNLGSDDQSYLETARIWLEKGMFTYNDPSKPTVFITPALPAFIALFMSGLGTGYVLEQTIRVVQVVMVSFSMILLFKIGIRLFNEKTALIAVVLTAVYPPMWNISFYILTEALFVLALMLLVHGALKAMDKPTAGNAVWFGLMWAFAVYVRPTIALWPGFFLLLLIYWRTIPWKKLAACMAVSALVFVLCLMPWWVRNYEVSGGQFIPLTKSSGNPLLLGTFPYGPPPVAEQRTWHASSDLWVNDAFDTQWAKERIRTGFAEQPLYYLQWYTIGKFVTFWGDVYYWNAVNWVSLILPVGIHYTILGFGIRGIWLARGKRLTYLLTVLFAYMSLLHMIYLAHSRYSAPLMPFMALFAGYAILQAWERKGRTGAAAGRKHQKPSLP
ncbi:ArnT family glycosyltransferase [Paenibacillus chitinolyticus]|uniref:ArnT family glycosyltransferase n=1 Tax=Paenibacillus chitinolyticus TaxID=79263 RepID=UPI00295E6620|nr:glycosyltransferase family 39 protein [Paenibacillus chitinolyticus]